jgi:hypothetical protein
MWITASRATSAIPLLVGGNQTSSERAKIRSQFLQTKRFGYETNLIKTAERIASIVETA